MEIIQFITEIALQHTMENFVKKIEIFSAKKSDYKLTTESYRLAKI